MADDAHTKKEEPLYGMMAEFETPEALVAAAHRVRAAGYTDVDAFSPFPIEGLHEAITDRSTRLPLVVLIAGLTGATTGFLLQYYLMAIDYPLNVGGRPLFSWPAFMPVTFEMGILFAAFGGVIGLILANGFPMLYHPVFNALGFDRASQDRFFLCIESTDPQYDREKSRHFLLELDPRPASVSEVAH